MKLSSLPARDGFYMPGEFQPHQGCLMIWPSRPGSWPFGAKAARKAFAAVAEAIAQSETVWMLCGEDCIESAREMLPPEIRVILMESDDAWARDVGPTFVVNGRGGLRGVDWRFNAWGGEVDGLYPHWEKDDAVASAFCEAIGADCYDAHPFVLEGGSIHSDGEGTVMVTEACLLSAGRNPQLSRLQIEEKLRAYLGAETVIWLPHGIYQDETNEHVDNICTFVRPGEAVLAWTDDESDPQYAFSKACLDTLEAARDAKGRRIRVHKLPIPAVPVRVREGELDGYAFEDGEDRREAGERLAASYVNFYISTGGVIVPQFGDKNDAEAVRILAELFPQRRVYPIPARDILLGGGNIHCITQQIPVSGEEQVHA